MRLPLSILLALALLVGLTTLPSTGPLTTADARAAAAPEIHLQLQFRPERGSSTVRYAAIHCEGSRATAAGWLTNRPVRACRIARRQAAILKRKAPPRTQTCLAAIYGPQVASVRGTIGGRWVSRELRRTDSCWEREWQAVAGLLPHVG